MTFSNMKQTYFVPAWLVHNLFRRRKKKKRKNNITSLFVWLCNYKRIYMYAKIILTNERREREKKEEEKREKIAHPYQQVIKNIRHINQLFKCCSFKSLYVQHTSAAITRCLHIFRCIRLDASLSSGHLCV